MQTLDPGIRCFSDLRAWMDAAAPDLAGRRILMYCTGARALCSAAGSVSMAYLVGVVQLACVQH